MKRFLQSIVAIALLLLFFPICVEASMPAVTGVKQTEGYTHSFSFEWTNLATADFYEVDISVDGRTWVATKETYSNRYTFSDVDSGASYLVRVRGVADVWVDASQQYVTVYGAYSAPIECVTAPEFPDIPLTINALTETGFTISWNPVKGANAYEASATRSDGTVVLQPGITTKNSISAINLAPNTKYDVTIKAYRVNRAGTFAATSSESDYTHYGIKVLPTKPTTVTMSVYPVLGEATVKCDLNNNADGYSAEVYTIGKKKDTLVSRDEQESSYFSFSRSTYKKPRVYKYRMRAYTTLSNGKKVYGQWSDWNYETVFPEYNKVKRIKSGFQISWKKMQGIDRYDVYGSYSKDSGYKKIKTVKTNKLKVTKFRKQRLKSGEIYYFYVVPRVKINGKYKAVGLPDTVYYVEYN